MLQKNVLSAKNIPYAMVLNKTMMSYNHDSNPISGENHTHTIHVPVSGSKVASCSFEMPVRCEDIPRGSSGIDFDMDQETQDGAKVSVKGNVTVEFFPN